MSRRPDPPCEHFDDTIGTISAGNEKAGPFSSVVTCRDCVTKSAGYVTLVTGILANPLLTFEEARRRRVAQGQ